MKGDSEIRRLLNGSWTQSSSLGQCSEAKQPGMDILGYSVERGEKAARAS